MDTPPVIQNFRLRLAVFGPLSVAGFCCAVAIALHYSLTVPEHLHGNYALAYLLGRYFYACLICIPSFACAVVGFLRRERPLYPAVVGILFNALPALFLVYIFLLSPGRYVSDRTPARLGSVGILRAANTCRSECVGRVSVPSESHWRRIVERFR